MNLSMYSKNIKMNWSIISIKRDPFWYVIGFVIALFCGHKAFHVSPIVAVDFIKTFTILSGTLLGFLVTSFSILFAISDRDFVKRLKADGKIDNLANQVAFTSSVLILGLVFSIIYLIGHNHILVPIISGIVVFSIVMFARVAYKYKQIFKFI